MFDRNKFRGKVVSEGFTLAEVAEKIGINPATLDRKMSGKSDFTRAELQKLKRLLNLTDAELNEIFFAEELA